MREDEMKKDQIIAELAQTRARLVNQLKAVPPERLDEVFLGTWSVRDLLAHLIGWDETNLEAVQDLLAGRLPAFYARFNPDWAAYNAELVERHCQPDFDAMLAAFTQTHEKLLAVLRGLPSGEIEKDRGVRSHNHIITIDRVLEAEIDDEDKHLHQIRAWLSETPRAA